MATMFYIDIRTVGRLEEFYFGLRDDEKVRAEAARKADAILASMKSVYSPPK